MAFNKFLGRNFEAAVLKGTEEQFENMACLTDGARLWMDKLSDQLSGSKEHFATYESPKDLADSIIENIKAIVSLRKSIERQ